MSGNTLINFTMALIATCSMEAESLKGLAWYWWYYLRYRWA